MKKFIQKTFVFLAIPIVYFGVNMFINYLIYEQENEKIQTEVLIIGDSHPQKGINPDLFTKAVNIAEPGEPYFVTYWKLKNILKESKLDTVIIGFAPHNISAFNDLKLSDKFWSTEMFKRIYPIQEFYRLKEISVDYVGFLKVLWKETGFFPRTKHMEFNKDYQNSAHSNLSDISMTLKRHYYYNGSELGVSEIAISYLDSITTLTLSKGINTVLVSHPVHQDYYKGIPEEIKLKYKELQKDMNPGIIIIDHTKNIYQDSLFLDADHLNRFGAEKFTSGLKQILKEQRL